MITPFRVMNPHQRCLQAKVKYRNEPKHIMPKSEDIGRSLEINEIWKFGTEFTDGYCDRRHNRRVNNSNLNLFNKLLLQVVN